MIKNKTSVFYFVTIISCKCCYEQQMEELNRHRKELNKYIFVVKCECIFCFIHKTDVYKDEK